MASSKVMASTSPPNPDLPRQSASTVHSSSSTTGFNQTTPSSSSVSNLLQQQSNPQPSPTTNNNNNSLHYSDRSNSPFGSMNMEEILKNIYSEPDSLASAVDGAAGISDVPAAIDGTGGVVKNVGSAGNKTVDEVWKEIVTGGGGGGGAGGSREPRMTLEDFLTKAGAVSEEDVRVHNSGPPPVAVPVPVPVPAPASGGYGVDSMMNVQFPVVHMQNDPVGFGLESPLGFGNGMVAVASAALGGHVGNGSTSGRGKRRAAPVEETALDKATQQKQRRMIKNRESAARSRERKQVSFSIPLSFAYHNKVNFVAFTSLFSFTFFILLYLNLMNACVNWSRFQAYTVELESMVTQLEEEHARLLREEVKHFSHGARLRHFKVLSSILYVKLLELLADEQIEFQNCFSF